MSDSCENVATHAAKSQWDSAGRASAECNVNGWVAASSEGENEVIRGVADGSESEKEKGSSGRVANSTLHSEASFGAFIRAKITVAGV